VSEKVVTIGEVVKIGAELKREPRAGCARGERRPAWLAKRVLREWLAARAPK
jgi:hypothetical protein